jgi:hypothetical protein
MKVQGPGGLFLATAGAHLALALFVVWRMKVRPAVPRERRTGFDLATTAPTMVALPPDRADP